MGAVLRVAVNGRELNLARRPITDFDCGRDRAYLYRPSTVKIAAKRERNGKVKVFTQEEIKDFVESGVEV